LGEFREEGRLTLFVWRAVRRISRFILLHILSQWPTRASRVPRAVKQRLFTIRRIPCFNNGTLKLRIRPHRALGEAQIRP
jgi:hypothetical protein